MNVKIIFLLLFGLTFVSCDEKKELTFDEKIEAALVAEFPTDSIKIITVIDSITVAILDSSEIVLAKVKPLIDISIAGVPARIDSAKSKLEKAKVDSAEANELLRPNFTSQIKEWQRILRNEEANLKQNKDLLEQNNAERDFIKEGRTNAKKGLAYYIVRATISDTAKRIAINPDFEVVRVFKD